MLLPEYKLITIFQNNSRILYTLIFDKLEAIISGDAKYNRLELKFVIKNGIKRRNVNLLKYLKTINDFLISNNYVCIYDNRSINLLNPNIVKFITIEKLKITSGEMEFISNNFPNLRSLETIKCSIYSKANMGVLNCGYIDINSEIMTLDSYNGFSGRYLYFNESHILSNNKNFLHLYNTILKFYKVDINYETLILTMDATNLRKLEIIRPRNKQLSNNDLLFISGLYNLESIDVDAIINSNEQIKKLERLRKVKGILLNDPIEMSKTKKLQEKYYSIKKENGESEKRLNEYLMFQSMILYNKHLDLLQELYVKRIDRVNWENKISINDIERIKKELIEISNMFYKDRRKISRDSIQFTLEDQLDELLFDNDHSNDEEEYLINSRPFQDGGIDYYVKRKKIILDK